MTRPARITYMSTLASGNASGVNKFTATSLAHAKRIVEKQYLGLWPKGWTGTWVKANRPGTYSFKAFNSAGKPQHKANVVLFTEGAWRKSMARKVNKLAVA